MNDMIDSIACALWMEEASQVLGFRPPELKMQHWKSIQEKDKEPFRRRAVAALLQMMIPTPEMEAGGRDALAQWIEGIPLKRPVANQWEISNAVFTAMVKAALCEKFESDGLQDD